MSVHFHFVILALFLVFTNTSNACINIEGVTIDGTYEMVEGDSPLSYLQHQLKTQPVERSERILGRLEHKKPKGDPEITFAVIEILEGNYHEAIRRLHAVEAAEPGNYITASNLGTAYELAGDNESALHWIAEGVKRHKDAHFATEWLHKLILETKIVMESNPGYLESNHILPTAELTARDAELTLDIAGAARPASALIFALQYQLGERMLFVKPTDAVVADLLYSFAILEANARVLEPAVGLLELSREYGYHDAGAIDEKILNFQSLIDATPKITSREIWINVIGLVFWGTVLLVLLGSGYLLYRRIRTANSGR